MYRGLMLMAALLRSFKLYRGRVFGRTMASTADGTSKFLEVGHEEYIAYHHTPGKSPGVLFLPGFMSNMNGKKALALERFCRKIGHSFTRFDYRGHGKSSGKHEECTVGMRKQDAMAILETTEGPQILVGSSLGGWIMLLVAMAIPERIRGLVGVATAADFLCRLYDNLPEDVKKEVNTMGKLPIPSSYSSEPYQISLNVIDEARVHALQDKTIPIICPVRLIHGVKDCEVPYQVSLDLVGQLESKDVHVTLIKEGNHRLSDPENLKLLTRNVEDLIEHFSKQGDHSSL